MKLAWESALLLPVLVLLPVTVTQAQTCSNGIPGYEASSTCCPLYCGNCGGPGCSKRGEGCCTSGIKDSGVKCSSSKSAPCIIDSDRVDTSSQTCPGGIPGINAKDVVCCPLSCGSCGGKGCTSRPGGRNSCCGSGIKETQDLCSKTKKAPCNIVDEGPTQTCPGGIPGINANDAVCCPLSCGSCGGKGCTSRPGGRNSCCGSGIKETQDLCSKTKKAPCVLAEEDSSDDSTDNASTKFKDSGAEFGVRYAGEGTYYGHTTAGNCAFFDNVPRMYDGMIPVALNNAQYGDSLMCGACVEGTANGKGSGRSPIPSRFKGFITDKCPECAHGDLDFAMSGDGRWEIEWEFVECPGEDISFVSPSANGYYWKVQPRGTKTPVKYLSFGGQTGARTDDNHFVFQKSGGGGWSGTQWLETYEMDGEKEWTQWTFY